MLCQEDMGYELLIGEVEYFGVLLGVDSKQLRSGRNISLH